jgi:NAD(P)-dependent dehydrogenase (short-subunit alcohol dehydrogenase family)
VGGLVVARRDHAASVSDERPSRDPDAANSRRPHPECHRISGNAIAFSEWPSDLGAVDVVVAAARVAGMAVAVVTGASSGFGLGVASSLAERWWDVIGTVLPGVVVDVPWRTVELDVTDDDACAALRDVVGDHVHALVNNAGIALAGPWEEVAPSELRRILDINVVGAMAVTRACLPALRAAGGVIVNVSSVSGQAGDPLMGPYNASKFALEGASEALRAELKAFGVRVHVVEPGPFRTPISRAGEAAAARGEAGVYGEHWKTIDDWMTWHAASSADPQVCIDAIVGAVLRDDAPFRIPVGEGISDVVRRHAAKVADSATRADTWLHTLA